MCIMACDNEPKIIGKKQMKNHMMDDCPKTLVLCSKCKGAITRMDIEAHDCMEHLFMRVKNLAAQNNRYV